MTRNTDPVPETPNPNPSASAVSAEHLDTSTEQVVLRRSPRYLRLIALGAGVGAAVAFFAAVIPEPADGYSQAQVFGFLLIFGIVFGGALGILVALLLDKVVARGQSTVLANKLVVHGEDPPETDGTGSAPTALSAPTAQSEQSEQSEQPAQPAPAIDTVSVDPERGRPAP